jgi:hypothetical protein
MTILEEEDGSCKLVDTFAIIIQTLMATLALCSLLYKRYIEKPRRRWRVWIMDTSKQAISAMLIHFVNIFLSYFSTFLPHTGQKSQNPCVWYFLNLLMDTTIGVYFLYLFLLKIHAVAKHFGIIEIEMGFYGEPPKIYSWIKQLVLFLVSWVCVKATVIILLTFIPIFGVITEWIFSFFNGHTKMQVVFVMFIFPLIMNIVQAWLIDKVIKADVAYIALDDDLTEEPFSTTENELVVEDDTSPSLI